MPTELNRSFLAVYLEWKEKNPSRLQKAVLRSLDHAFHFFKEIDQFPYEEISDDMITFFIE